MKSFLKYFLLTLALALTTSTRAHAGWFWDPPKQQPIPPGNNAPEVDPSLAIGGFTLLAGTLTVMRSRRRK